jgi:hypothetical protein
METVRAPWPSEPPEDMIQQWLQKSAPKEDQRGKNLL